MRINKNIVIIGSIVILSLLMATKSKAAEIISLFEGKENEAYQDQGGVWTIGYGSTWNRDENRPVKEGDKISDQKALEWLKLAIKDIQDDIIKLVKVPINQNQKDSLTSFAYNIGRGAFEYSTLLKLLNKNTPKIQVADQFLRWNKVNGVVNKGLTIRRNKERELFLS
jgi:lysozyme